MCPVCVFMAYPISGSIPNNPDPGCKRNSGSMIPHCIEDGAHLRDHSGVIGGAEYQ